MNGKSLGVLFCLILFQAAAWAAQIPMPRSKPMSQSSVSNAVPIPRAKPFVERQVAGLDPTVVAPEEPQPVPEQKQIKSLWPREMGRWPRPSVSTARQNCEQLLKGLKLIWRPDTPIGQSGGCGTAAPIAVSEIAGVRLNPPATMNCELASALHGWVEGSLQPAAKKSVGSKVLEIKNASSYACRRRNNAKRGKLSEHAFANALDISGFVFAKNAQVSVKGDLSGLFQSVGLSSRGNFLRRIRKDACQYFNTVLGPGSDPFHKDHLHFDLMKLRPGRFKMCR